MHNDTLNYLYPKRGLSCQSSKPLQDAAFSASMFPPLTLSTTNAPHTHRNWENAHIFIHPAKDQTRTECKKSQMQLVKRQTMQR